MGRPNLAEVVDLAAVVTVIAAEDMEGEALEVVTGVEVAVEDATEDLSKEETEVDVTEVAIEKEDTGKHM